MTSARLKSAANSRGRAFQFDQGLEQQRQPRRQHDMIAPDYAHELVQRRAQVEIAQRMPQVVRHEVVQVRPQPVARAVCRTRA